MRKKHFIGGLATGAMALLLSILPTACSHERENIPTTPSETGEKIGFAVNLWQEGGKAQTAQTKSVESVATGSGPTVDIVALEGETTEDGQQLYLHTVTTDGIETGAEETAENRNGTEESIAHTKAAPVTTDKMYEDMSVTAFIYPVGDNWQEAYEKGEATSYINGLKVKKSEGWSTSYSWPGARNTISFFASAPYDCQGLTAVNAGDKDKNKLPYLSYTVPSDVAKQKDLLAAAAVERPGNTNETQQLKMKHVLTGIRFATDSDMQPGTVSKITLKGVYGKGKLPFEVSPAWYDLEEKKDFTQTLPAVPTNPNTQLTSEEATFMMLPQTLPKDAKIEVEYKNTEGVLRILMADISGTEWTMGKTITYKISTNNMTVVPTLTVTPPAEFTYQGGTGTYTVESYITIMEDGGKSQTVPVGWTTEFSEDGGKNWSTNKPAWLTVFTASGSGEPSQTSFTATVAAQNGLPNSPGDLKIKSPVNDVNGTDVYDLSTKGGTTEMNTANCYIVNAAGRYRLPLVYGNGIKDGQENKAAYTSNASGTNVLKNFVDHSGRNITSADIESNPGNNPHECKLIWQDEKDLVTDVKLSYDKRGFLDFTVKRETIKEGNAVVAVLGYGGEVLWSWHIWVTSYNPGTEDKTITNHKGKQYTVMPINIGWCADPIMIYKERTVQVRFKQQLVAGHAFNRKEEIFTLQQKEHTTATGKGNIRSTNGDAKTRL